jgi:hypothetical protein
VPVDLTGPAPAATAPTTTTTGAHKHAVRAIWLRRTVYNAHDTMHRELIALELATLQPLRLMVGENRRVVSIIVATRAGELLIGMRQQRTVVVLP